MPTTLVSLRIDSELLKYLKKRAEEEHRTLSNMIVSILMDGTEHKTGYWENGHCTCCGEDIASRLDTWTNVQTFSFCPKCGAEMEVK